MLTIFFQKQWHCVGSSITEFVKEVFRTWVVLEEMNKSTICLLPKIEQPEHISQFRPICLSNMIIKVISKIIANRLKVVIGELTSVWQISFILSRQASDNIVLAQESIHSLQKLKGKLGE